MAAEIHHPIFARFYTLLSRRESADQRQHRRDLLAGLSGRVLELGAGAGANFVHYPSTVSEVVAVEPEAFLREQARAEAARARVPITVVEGAADELPAADASCDAGVACLVLCSVPSQATALAELLRVVRPGGELRFYEHVLAHQPALAGAQRLLDKMFWPRAFGGCHTARDTPAAIAQAGFQIEAQRRVWVAPLPLAAPVATHALGRARRP